MVIWKKFVGLTPYEDALTAMEQQVASMVAGNTEENVWLLEHPALYTAGTSAKIADLKNTDLFPTFHTGRGGEWTYHGPGQRVGYVMLNLKARNEMDVRAYVTKLENWIIATLAHFGVQGEIREGRVGVWVVMPDGSESKIAALGIRIRKWVTFHGIALNVCPDLEHYKGIVPCGISEHGVTSLHALGIDASMEDVDSVLRDQYTTIFG